MTSADEDYGSHRRRGDTRRGPAHAKTSPRWPDVGTGPFAAQGTFEAAPPRGGDPRFGRQDPRWPDPRPPPYQEARPAARPSTPSGSPSPAIRPSTPAGPGSRVPRPSTRAGPGSRVPRPSTRAGPGSPGTSP